MFRRTGRFLPFLLLLPLARSAAAGVDRWTPLGPDGGTVQALAADPGVPDTVYAGADGSGVWKSTDGGVHWSFASQGLGSAEIHALAAASGTVWAATRGGLYTSDDGGASWTLSWYQADRLDDTLTPWTLSVAADPIHAGVAWAGTARGWVLKTEDGGATWDQVLDLVGEADLLLIHPADPATVWAVGRLGLYQTLDGGTTWTPLRQQYLPALALDPADPRLLYSSGGPGAVLGLWKSRNGGSSWFRLPGLADKMVTALLVDPFDSSVLLAGAGGELWRSEDAGTAWRKVPGLPLPQPVALAADPIQPGRIWLGTNERAVFRSLDAGSSWTASRQGLSASHLVAADFDPVRPRTLYAAAIDTGVHRSTDLGRTWTRINAGLPTAEGYGVLVNTVAARPLRPGTLYAGTGEGVYRSLDRGAHWSFVSAVPSEDFNTFAFDPLRPDTIFAGGNILVRSRNGGRTWTRLVLPGTTYEPEIAEVVVSPLRPRTVFVLDFNQRRGEARSLFRSPDGGGTWTLVFEGGPAALAPHPTRPDIFYLATESGGNIWQSIDGGLTWAQLATGVGGGAALTSLLVDRLDPAILYLGTDGAGVWWSPDHGVTWAPLNTGLTAPRITCLKAKPQNPRRLFACTWGGGLMEIRISSTP